MDFKVEFNAESDGATDFWKNVSKVPILGQTGDQTDFEVILANFTRYWPFFINYEGDIDK